MSIIHGNISGVNVVLKFYFEFLAEKWRIIIVSEEIDKEL